MTPASSSPLLSVYFGTHRTQALLIAPGPKGLEILGVESSPKVLDETSDYIDVLTELERLLPPLAEKANRMSLTISSELTFPHRLPSPNNLPVDDRKSFIIYDLSKNLPKGSVADFSVFHQPLSKRMDGQDWDMLFAVEKSYLERAEFVMNVCPLPLTSISISPIPSTQAFTYNYPEYASDISLLVGVQEFLDITVVRAGKLVHVETRRFERDRDFGQQCKEIAERLSPSIVPFVDNCFLYGDLLHRELFDQVRTSLELVVKRLNAFRMIMPKVSQREQEYLSRTAHLFPACLGSAVPGWGSHLEKIL